MMFETPLGRRYRLQRLPYHPKSPLRAWDAADEYLLAEWAQAPNCPPGRLLIFNDAFGALATALHAYAPFVVSDSVTAHRACQENYQRNQLDHQSLHLLDSLQVPNLPVETILLKIPKNLALLEWQLQQIRRLALPHTRIWLAGMIKNLPTRVWRLTEYYLGPTTTLPGKKKAKLIKVDFRPQAVSALTTYPTHYFLEGTSYRIINHANVFSREKLDIGSRFFIAHFPRTQGQVQILDLGCGSGVLALMARHYNPHAQIHCVDESFMAIASARATLKAAFGAYAPGLHFHAAHDLAMFPSASIDQVLCNPPFHQQHAMSDHIAWQMFKNACRVLRPGGDLWIVSNRHLNYRQKLKRLFSTVEQIACNRKFVILHARQSTPP